LAPLPALRALLPPPGKRRHSDRGSLAATERPPRPARLRAREGRPVPGGAGKACQARPARLRPRCLRPVRRPPRLASRPGTLRPKPVATSLPFGALPLPEPVRETGPEAPAGHSMRAREIRLPLRALKRSPSFRAHFRTGFGWPFRNSMAAPRPLWPLRRTLQIRGFLPL
jgi:hypothetical protein